MKKKTIFLISILIIWSIIFVIDYKKNSVQAADKTLEDGTYTIKSALNEKFVFDIVGSSKENGANLNLWENGSTSNQKFNVKHVGNGIYNISVVCSGKHIDVSGSGKNKGTNVAQWEYHGGENQQWIIKDAGNGYYNIVSKCNGLYLDVPQSNAKPGANIHVWEKNNAQNQMFKFEKVNIDSTSNKENEIKAEVTIKDGMYTIKSALNEKFVFDVVGSSKENGANLNLWTSGSTNNQKFDVKHIGNGLYNISVVCSGKYIDVSGSGKSNGTNVAQWEYHGGKNQQWIIKDAGNGYYNIISKCNGLYLDIPNSNAKAGANVQVWEKSNAKNQMFKFEATTKNEAQKDNTLSKDNEKPKKTVTIDEKKYPGYSSILNKLQSEHPNWNFEILYTGLNFDEVVKGETNVHSRNLVPQNYAGEWVCSVCGTKLYDSGWYCASEKAVAYYMDPRNFLDATNIFQFQDLNKYIEGTCTLEGLQNKVDGTFLEKYASDIDKACKNKNVNSYYITARLLQEQGRNGTQIGKGMDGGDGKTYYNPFNIGANGNGWETIYNNALKKAKACGWDSMERAIEGGIDFCKKNWLENYQNTLYQNKFDIDTRNGTSLYVHQYMQNLIAAYSEARTMQTMYSNTNKLESGFTFIIPVYENMPYEKSALPTNNKEIYPINMKVQVNGNLNLREGASAESKVITKVANGTVVLSIERGINSNWQKIILVDGTIGYMSGEYLKQVEDVKTCNYSRSVKTNDGSGCRVRFGPSLKMDKMTTLSDGTTVQVIDDSTYRNIDGYDWYRIILPDGSQGFMPGKYLK